MNIEKALQDLLNDENSLNIKEEEIKHDRFLLNQRIDLIREYELLSIKVETLSKKSNLEDGDYSRTKDRIEAINRIMKDYEERIMEDRVLLERDKSLTDFKDLKKSMDLVAIDESVFDNIFGLGKHKSREDLSRAEEIAANISRQSASGGVLTLDEKGDPVSNISKEELESATSSMQLADEIAELAEYFKSSL